MRKGLSRTIAVAATAAIAASGTAAMGEDDGSRDDDGRGDRGDFNFSRDDDRRSGGARFATVRLDGPKPGQTLVLFDRRSRRNVPLTGLAVGERVVGIDVRPATGVLYGLSSANRVFTINTSTGQIGNAVTLTVPLNGAFFGVDFNPSVDRLRVTSDADQNLRINVDTGATTNDPALQYPMGDRNFGKDPAVTHVGYTFAVMTGPTALYDIDTATDTFTLQNPPNLGTLNSIGPIGIDVPAQGGFDITGTQTFTALGFYQVGNVARLFEHRFDQNGRATPTGIALSGSYDGFAVLPRSGGAGD